MFTKIINTKYRPEKPVLIWDGECPFCRYWILKWKNLTQNQVDYRPYQEIADQIMDIPESDFRQAARLIEPNGRVFNGPEAAFRALSYTKKYSKWHRRYKKSDFFKYLCDQGYVFIANHRKLMFKLTKFFLGKNPVKPKPIWKFQKL